jgi:hypothetical protein
VFELTLFGGARRLFMASSVLERDAWVSAIKIAMTGTLDFLSDNYIKPVKFAAFLSTAIKGSQYTVANAYRLLQQGAGAAAPYAEEIARFTSLQVAAQTTSTPDGLKEILQVIHSLTGLLIGLLTHSLTHSYLLTHSLSHLLTYLLTHSLIYVENACAWHSRDDPRVLHQE